MRRPTPLPAATASSPTSPGLERRADRAAGERVEDERTDGERDAVAAAGPAAQPHGDTQATDQIDVVFPDASRRARADQAARSRPAPGQSQGDSGGEAVTAPVIPLPAAGSRSGSGRGDDSGSDDTGGDDHDPGGHRSSGASAPADTTSAGGNLFASLTARDVWAAARARRKALRAEVRRFTARQRRRRMVWILSLAAVAATILGTLAAAYSPLFAVREIEVIGTSMLDAGEVEQALAAQLGTPLPLVDASEVKAALVAFPLVETYTLEARPPHGLVVRIVERTPIGTIESAAGFTLVDAAGVALSTTEKRPDGYPELEITGGAGSRAFAAAGLVFRSLPDELAERVTKITATTANDVTLTLAEPKTTVVWGTADESAYKAVVLEAAMTASPDMSSYDVSAPNAVVAR